MTLCTYFYIIYCVVLAVWMIWITPCKVFSLMWARPKIMTFTEASDLCLSFRCRCLGPGSISLRVYELIIIIMIIIIIINTWSSYMKILIQSSHNFAHVTTAQLLWHVQNRGLIGLENSKLELQNFTRFESWAHKTLSEVVLWWHEATTCANIDLPTNQFLWYSH